MAHPKPPLPKLTWTRRPAPEVGDARPKSAVADLDELVKMSKFLRSELTSLSGAVDILAQTMLQDRDEGMRERTAAIEIGAAKRLIVTFLVFGTLFFSLVEGWSFLEAFYYSWITLTTIGYGDYYPTKPVSQVVFVLYSIAGLGILTYCVGVFVQSSSHKVKPRVTIWFILQQFAKFLAVVAFGGWIFATSEKWSYQGLVLSFTCTLLTGCPLLPPV